MMHHSLSGQIIEPLLRTVVRWGTARDFTRREYDGNRGGQNAAVSDALGRDSVVHAERAFRADDREVIQASSSQLEGNFRFSAQS